MLLLACLRTGLPEAASRLSSFSTAAWNASSTLEAFFALVSRNGRPPFDSHQARISSVETEMEGGRMVTVERASREHLHSAQAVNGSKSAMSTGIKLRQFYS